MNRPLLLHLIGFLFLSYLSLPVLGQVECSPVNYRRAFAKAHDVFIGEAIEYKDNPNVQEDGLLIVKFKVEKSWKGSKTTEITVPTTLGLPGGDLFVRIGKKYLVYTEGKKRIMYFGCSASRTFVTDRSYNLTYQDAQIKQLNSWWFRFRSRIIPF